MAYLGIELTPERVRAVKRGWRGVSGTADIAWDPADAAGAAAELQAALGTAASVRLVISPLFTRVKSVALPAIPAAEQWRALALQPERYFAERPESQHNALAWQGESALAFLADGARIEQWVQAFARLGTVTHVLPGTVALAFTQPQDGTFALAGDSQQVAAATYSGGRLVGARAAPANAGPHDPLPAAAGASGEFRAALGATRVSGLDDWASLVTPALLQRLRGQRHRSLAAAAIAAVVALIAMLAALDASRNAYADRLQRAIAAAEREAQPGLALRRRLAGLEQEAHVLRASASAVDALQTVATMSEVLPRSVVVVRLRMSADEWQLSGRARGGEAAAVVPALERDGRFTDVRMTSPSTRFREDGQDFESFSVAFRVRPTD